MHLEIFGSEDKRLPIIRNYVEKAYNKKYIGWSSEFDSKFDSQAICFVIYDQNLIVATSKLIFNRDQSNNFLSVKYAQSSNFDLRNYKIVCEGTGLWYSNKIFLEPLWYAMFKWLDHYTSGVCLSLFDRKNKNIAKGNMEILRFAPIDDARIVFQDIQTVDRLPVIWTPAIQDQCSRRESINKFSCINLLTNSHLRFEPPTFITSHYG